MTNEILDQPLFTEKQNNQILEAVSWWEKKRLLYNMIVGTVGLLCSILYLKTAFFHPIHIINATFYGLMANVCYTASWVCEILFFYYISRNFSFVPFRMPLFIMGTLGSVILTMILALLIGTLMVTTF